MRTSAALLLVSLVACPTARACRGPRSIEQLSVVLDSGEVDARWQAAKALGAYSCSTAVGRLMAAMCDDSVLSVRWEATKSLVRIGRPAIGPLIDYLNGPYGCGDTTVLPMRRLEIAVNVIWALGEIGDSAAVGPLVRALTGPTRMGLYHQIPPGPRATAAAALAKIGRPAARPMLSLLASGSAYDKLRAAWVLGHSGETTGLVPTFQYALAPNLIPHAARHYIDYGVHRSLLAYGLPAYRMLAAELADPDYRRRDLAKKLLTEAGSSAFGEVASQLRDGNFQARLEAGLLLVNIAGQRAVPNLVAALGDTVPWLRREALKRLGTVGGSRAVAAVCGFARAHRSDGDGDFAVTVLSWARPLAAGELAAGLPRLDDRLRRDVATNLCLNPDRTAGKILHSLRGDPDSATRTAATLALAKLGDTTVTAAVCSLRCDPAEKFDALLAIGGGAAAGPIALFLRDSSNRRMLNWPRAVRGLEVVESASHALACTVAVALHSRGRLPMCAVPYALLGPSVLSELYRERDRPTESFIDSLVDIIGAPALDTLEALIARPGSRGRIRFASVAAKHGSAPARSILIAGLQDPDAGTHEEAAKALLEIRCPDAIPALLAAREDNDGLVVRDCYAALAYSGNPEAIDTLLADLESMLPARSLPAARALGDAGEKRAMPLLLAMLDGDNPRLVDAAVRAMAAIDPGGSVAVLNRLVLGSRPGTAVAVDRLAQIADRRSVRALTSALSDAPNSTTGRNSYAAAIGLSRIGGREALKALADYAAHLPEDPQRLVWWRALVDSRDPRVEGVLLRLAFWSADTEMLRAFGHYRSRVLRDAAYPPFLEAHGLSLDEDIVRRDEEMMRL